MYLSDDEETQEAVLESFRRGWGEILRGDTIPASELVNVLRDDEYRLSKLLIERVQELMERNRSGTLTMDEQDEMDEFLRMEHFMTMLKLKVRLLL